MANSVNPDQTVCTVCICHFVRLFDAKFRTFTICPFSSWVLNFFRYVHEVQKDGRIFQANNPEVTVDVQEDNGIISVQIFNLKLITSKLQNAYNGLEVEWSKRPVDIGNLLLTFTILWANSADDKSMMFFLFFSENRVWHFIKLSQMETICMKCQNLFSGKNKKKYFKMSSEIFTQSAKL